MKYEEIIQLMSHTPDILNALYSGVPDEQLRWKAAAGKWSILEVLGHLLDEEKADFRTRLRLTLEDPAAVWPPIDPKRWVKERDHNRQDVSRLLQDFRRERTASLSWLKTVGKPAWNNTHTHRSLGELRAGDLLASWAAHDQRHLQQLHGIRLAWIDKTVKPYSRSYAG